MSAMQKLKERISVAQASGLVDLKFCVANRQADNASADGVAQEIMDILDGEESGINREYMDF